MKVIHLISGGDSGGAGDSGNTGGDNTGGDTGSGTGDDDDTGDTGDDTSDIRLYVHMDYGDFINDMNGEERRFC